MPEHSGKQKKIRFAILVMIGLIILPGFACGSVRAFGELFRVANYNVENLFDLELSGLEYKEYLPNSNLGWDKRVAGIKYSNIARVIKDLDAEIVTLQEVESYKALLLLKNKLSEMGTSYPFFEIAVSSNTNANCAVLSKFKIVQADTIPVNNGYGRAILKVVADVNGNPLTIFVNHWKSKKSPESRRIKYAVELKKQIDKLPPGVDYLLIGDFNSNHNEFKTFAGNPRLNDTKGITGINHVLKTIEGSKQVRSEMLKIGTCKGCLYNLWMEIEPENRWSHIFWGEKGSIDNIIIPFALFDNKKISYVKGSFKRFAPGYLFKEKKIFRWQRGRRGKGRHIGEGFSDHLPVFADFYSSTK